MSDWDDDMYASDTSDPEIQRRCRRRSPCTREAFAKTMQKLRSAVPTRYGQTTQVPTIYRVPVELANDHKDYHPVAVYIGGFAHKFVRMTCKLEEYKWCCVRQLISRHSRLLEPAKTHVLLLGCLESIKSRLPQIRASYAEDINADDDELAEMMLVDGCFILHRLLGEEEDHDWTQDFGRFWVWQSAIRDLLLLENQIPFFVLQELFEQLRNDDEPEERLVTGGLLLFRFLDPRMMHSSPITGNNVHHLLHLFYLSVGLPPSDVREHSRHHLQCVPCARELEEAGFRFRRRKNATSFLDISFDSRTGVLEIPLLQLYDSSSALIRNLIAFEQAYPHIRCDVSTYAIFMDDLINTPKDMQILERYGILVYLKNGEQDPSRFFSQICAQVHSYTDNYLADVMSKVSKHMISRRHKWRARRHKWWVALVRNYFSNPWRALSVLAAVLLLAMTALQTFFTVYPYFKPAKSN